MVTTSDTDEESINDKHHPLARSTSDNAESKSERKKKRTSLLISPRDRKSLSNPDATEEDSKSESHHHHIPRSTSDIGDTKSERKKKRSSLMLTPGTEHKGSTSNAETKDEESTSDTHRHPLVRSTSDTPEAALSKSERKKKRSSVALVSPTVELKISKESVGKTLSRSNLYVNCFNI